MIDSTQFPSLFAVFSYEAIRGQFEILAALPPIELIANISIVPFVENKCVIIQLENGLWEIPGGTLEPGEIYLNAARREMLEEAGARLIDFHPFGAWNCQSLAERPYRAHLPHPRFYRPVGYGEVKVIGAPLNPPDGEKVTSVDIVTIKEAANRFRSIGRGDLADLYQLAAFLRERAINANY